MSDLRFSGSRFRHEIKMEISARTAERLRRDLEPYCVPDEHAGLNGCYETASLYYDTRDLRFYWDREESVANRRKVRLRAYNCGGTTTALFLEIKEKHKHLVAKKRINLRNVQILDRLESHDTLPLRAVLEVADDSIAARELEYIHARLQLIPVAIIRYSRVALQCRFQHDLRITFDTRLSVGGTSMQRYDPLYEKWIIAPSRAILEIKTNRSIPMWLQGLLRQANVSQTRFSKYCEGARKMFGHVPILGERSEYLVDPHLPSSSIESPAALAG